VGNDRAKKYRAEFKFDERSVAPDYGETLTTSSLLETPSFSMEDLIQAFQQAEGIWDRLKKKHDIYPERGDRISPPTSTARCSIRRRTSPTG
jgi:hypothetical protein